MKAFSAQPPPFEGGKGDVPFGRIVRPATESNRAKKRTSPLTPPSKGGGCALKD